MEELLAARDKSAALEELLYMPPKKAVRPLIRALYSTDDAARFRAAEFLGAVAARMAEEDMEAARVVMRRLMWSLNDESGGIGWGAPEAMAEAMARSPGLREEFAAILVSYIDPEGNYLEHTPLRRGAVWGVMRVAREDPGSVRRAAGHLMRLLDSGDPAERGLCALALGHLKDRSALPRLEGLTCDHEKARVYLEGEATVKTVRELAREGISLMSQAP